MAAERKTTNQHWEVIANGVNVRIDTARDLWENSLLYFQWCDANPIQKPEMIRSGADVGETYTIPMPRAYTVTGLCLHVGITRDYLYTVSNQKEKNEFFFIANKILEIIYTQKLEMTYAGVFSPVIASKELGLANEQKANPQTPVINIEVQEGPKLLSDERDVDLPEDKI